MKTLTKLLKFAVLAVVGSTALLAGTAQCAENENFKATISADAQKQIQMLLPRDRKKVEAAIVGANRFIPFYLDGTYYLIVDKSWQHKIRPLVDKNAQDWYAMLNKNASGVELEIAKREATNLISICPQVELVKIELLPSLVLLKYRSRIVNVHKFRSGTSDLVDLILDDSMDFQEVEFGVNNRLIDFVRPKYFGTFGSTSSFVDSYKLLIQEDTREAQHASAEAQGKINEKIHQNERWLRVFQDQEAASCSQVR